LIENDAQQDRRDEWQGDSLSSLAEFGKRRSFVHSKFQQCRLADISTLCGLPAGPVTDNAIRFRNIPAHLSIPFWTAEHV
jgi:hypothetical protein